MRQGILDLQTDPDYTNITTLEDGKTQIVVSTSRVDGVATCRVKVQHKDKLAQEMSQEDMMRFAKDLLLGLFLTTEIPAEMVPEQIRSSLRVSSHWVREQAQIILPMMMQKLLDIEVIDGKVFMIDLGYKPNILSSGLVDAQGKKQDKWLGSFRPVVVLNEVQNMPENVGVPPHESVNEGRAEAHQHIASASPAEVIPIGSKARQPE